MLSKLQNYVEKFNKNDDELIIQKIPNGKAFEFLSEEIPLIECPDKCIEETYYFRFWTFRKHIKETPDGHIITEFLQEVPWSGAYNSINCPAGFHIREGRWLKSADTVIKDYIKFWLNFKGDTNLYSMWYAHAVLEYCNLKNDFAFGEECLFKLIDIFKMREKCHLRQGGIYWSHDGYDGMEYSISGSGFRPTLNSYAYGDAVAIAKIAEKLGLFEIEHEFLNKAEEIKNAVNNLLWDKDFYKVIPISEESENLYTERPMVNEKYDVKELLGFIPWYFSLPEAGKEKAFCELLKTDGFKSEYGLTTAEQRHPRFMEEISHECLWNGPVWPFATSQVLVAVANLLQNYEQSVITKNDYYEMLLQYAKAHYLTRSDGKIVNWIDENIHPFTGRWLSRDILESWGWKTEKGGFERGKDYNHSLFCDLVLSGLFGIDIKDGNLSVTPLIPDSWDYFRVENLHVCGKRYKITYDKTGSYYKNGKGLKIESY